MHERTLGAVVVALLLVAMPSPAMAQPAAPAPPHLSPEVLSDRRVTFRIYAPKANAVTLRGDWMEAPAPLTLTRNADGVWEGTTEPLGPDYYSYSLTVDGVRTLDTPPGYDSSTDRYPVLYLLHGGGDDDSGWSTIGRAGFIVDNLLASGAVRPLIVVMPNGSLPRPANLPPATPGAPPSPQAIAASAALQDRFTSELMSDVMPHVERYFRVAPRPERRAIAGLSMGGGQTQRVLGSHPGAFAYVAVWSAGVNPAATADFETRNAAMLGDAAKVNAAVKVLSISVGDKDFALPGTKNVAQILTSRGVTHTLHVSGGGHTWINWRRYLRDYLQVVFR